MKRELLPLKKLVLNGLIFGLFFGTMMAIFDYVNNEPFSIYQFLFYSIAYGFFMSLAFRYKYTKETVE